LFKSKSVKLFKFNGVAIILLRPSLKCME